MVIAARPAITSPETQTAPVTNPSFMLGYWHRKLTVAGAHFTYRDKEIVVRLSVPSRLALLLETALDKLSAALTSRDRRVQGVSLMFRDFLTDRHETVYFVVISLKSAIEDTVAQRLAAEVNRWESDTLRWVEIQPHRKVVPRDD